MSRRRFPPGRTFELVEVLPRSAAQTQLAADPVELAPIAWGKRDPALARAVCEHIADAMPPVVIRFNPITHRRVCAFLRSYGIAH